MPQQREKAWLAIEGRGCCDGNPAEGTGRHVAGDIGPARGVGVGTLYVGARQGVPELGRGISERRNRSSDLEG
jgi:hypothetical protein